MHKFNKQSNGDGDGKRTRKEHLKKLCKKKKRNGNVCLYNRDVS